MPIKTCIIDSRTKSFSSNWRLEESKTTQRSHFPQAKWHSKNQKKQVLTTIFRNRLLHYWLSHHIFFFWKWSSECSNATRSVLPHKPSDTRKLTFRRDDNNLYNRLMYYWFIHHNLFCENEDLNVSTTSEVLFPTSPVTVKILL